MKLDLASAPLKSGQDDIGLLNELGEEGWELVAITGEPAGLTQKTDAGVCACRRCCVGGQSDFGIGTQRSMETWATPWSMARLSVSQK
jgi:hypothetical protein